MKKSIYLILNGFCHLFHMGIILFVISAWIFPSLRLYHLLFILLMLSSWFVLGQWFGIGYCPITDWHWRIKQRFNRECPQGGYINELLKIISPQLSPALVDRGVMMTAGALLLISITVNLIHFL